MTRWIFLLSSANVQMPTDHLLSTTITEISFTKPFSYRKIYVTANEIWICRMKYTKKIRDFSGISDLISALNRSSLKKKLNYQMKFLIIRDHGMMVIPSTRDELTLFAISTGPSKDGNSTDERDHLTEPFNAVCLENFLELFQPVHQQVLLWRIFTFTQKDKSWFQVSRRSRFEEILV